MKETQTIGITGGMGSGKSVVSRILRCNGFMVYDCDSRARTLMMDDSEVKKNLIDVLGVEIYEKNGDLNRKRLANLMFTDDKIRNFVNSVVHAAVKKNIEKERRETKGVLFIESAILATSHLDSLCEKIWVVDAPLDLRIKRVQKRDCLSRKEIEKRIQTQKKEFILLEHNKIVKINNSGKNNILINILNLTKKLKPISQRSI